MRRYQHQRQPYNEASRVSSGFFQTRMLRPVVSFETEGPFVANLLLGRRTVPGSQYHSLEVTHAKFRDKGTVSPQ
jgi:hypothetical protein